MRKLSQAVAAVAALTMAMGMMVSAANSSTTSNTTTSSTSTVAETAATSYVITRAEAASGAKAAVVKVDGSNVRVSSNYSAVTDAKVVATAVAADKSTASAVKSAVAAAMPGKTVVGPVKIQFYKGGVAGQKSFGTFTAAVTVSARYNGQTVAVYIFNQDGTGQIVNATVVNGRVNVPLTQGATIVLAL